MSMTREQVKAKFKAQGLTFTQWARDNDYPIWAVQRVMAGVDKGHYGRAHEIAVKLGLKSEGDSENNLH